MLLLLTESRDTKHIHPTKCKDDFSYYQYFLVVLGNPRYRELSVTVQSYLTPYFMFNYKPNCPLFVLHYHRALSFILINLPWALSRLSSSPACVHNRNHFPREGEQQRWEGLSILQPQLKGCTKVVPDSEFQLFSPLTSEYQGDPSSGGHCAEGERVLGSARQQQQPLGMHLSPRLLCRHRLVLPGTPPACGSFARIQLNSLWKEKSSF